MPSRSADSDLSRYPAGTMLAEMVIDIYTKQSTGEVTILHDRPFQRGLYLLEFDPARRELWFATDSGRIPFGTRIKPAIARHLRRAKSVTVIQMDMPSRTPIARRQVPLHLEGPVPGAFDGIRRIARSTAGFLRETTYNLWIGSFPEL